MPDDSGLPTWNDVDAKLKAGGTLTAVEHFIFNEEPVSADVWRRRLKAALNEYAEERRTT